MVDTLREQIAERLFYRLDDGDWLPWRQDNVGERDKYYRAADAVLDIIREPLIKENP